MSYISPISVSGGESNFVTGEVITASHFGGVFVGYRNIDRFDGVADEIDAGLVRWPGGHAAETANWYGLEYDDLVQSGSNKSGLNDILPMVAENGSDLAIVIPTKDYAFNMAAGTSDVYDFMGRLMSGSLGELPEKIILELGNEYYGINSYVHNPGRYGQVADALMDGIKAYFDDHPQHEGLIDLDIAMQMGRSAADNAAILSNISNANLPDIDSLIYHRYSWTLDGADMLENHYNAAIQEWVDAGVGANVEVFVSEWNIASWTRSEALNMYTTLQAQYFGTNINRNSIDLDARNDADFELFWQTGGVRGSNGIVMETQYGLDKRDYGLAQASGMLEVFSSLLHTGADAMTLYGIDTGHAARISFGDERFVGSAMMEMMSESLPGTRLLTSSFDNSRSTDLTYHAFEGENKLVIYVTANSFNDEDGTLQTSLDLSELGYEIEGVTGRSLTSTLDANWMSKFGIVDRADIDESAEGRLYETGVISDMYLGLSGTSVELEFMTSFQVIEITVQIDRDPDALNEIDGTALDDILQGTMGDDLIESGDGDDEIIAGKGEDVITAGRGGDLVDGGAGDDFLNGGHGDDELIGGTGNDTVQGGGGDDMIHAGPGYDILAGGSGEDEFVFAHIDTTARIADFTQGEDVINLAPMLEQVDGWVLSLSTEFGTITGPLEDARDYMLIAMEQDGNDVVIKGISTLNDSLEPKDFIILENTSVSDMSWSDFQV